MKKYLFVSLAAFSILLIFFSLSVAAAGAPRGKSAAAGLIPDELKSMKIEDYFVESKGNSVGSIQDATGHVVVVHKDTNSAYFAATGDAVYQQDVFYTLQDSRCRIKFSTEDIITMGENGKVVAEEIVDDQVLKKKSSVISMLKGKTMFYVVRLFRYKTVSASVKTPTAVMGVRGTKFGVEVRKVSEKVADLSDNSFIYLAQNEPGSFETVVYGFEGTVDVTSTANGITQTVGAGENLVLDNTGAGNVVQTDPNTANQFLKETEGVVGGSSAGRSGAGLIAEVAEKVKETLNIAEDVSENIAQTLTSQTIETQIVSGARVGYFAALLTKFDFYPPTSISLADVYANSTRSNFNSSSVSGNSIVSPAGYISAVNTGSDQSTPYLTRINTVAGGPYDSGDLGYTREMNNVVNTAVWPMDDRLGQNSYMEWGFWAMSLWVSDGSSPYPKEFAVTDRAYYIDGLVTPDAAVAGMAGAYTYAGPAWGTYFNGGGGTDMTGIFSCAIDMTSKTVTDFDMSVSKTMGPSATIGNATGSFVGSSGEFKITGGDWSLTVYPSAPMPIVVGGVIQAGASASCTGSLFGPNAEHMGGAWAMDKGSGNHAAVGIFVGDKGGAPIPPAVPPVIPSPPSP